MSQDINTAVSAMNQYVFANEAHKCAMFLFFAKVITAAEYFRLDDMLESQEDETRKMAIKLVNAQYKKFKKECLENPEKKVA